MPRDLSADLTRTNANSEFSTSTSADDMDSMNAANEGQLFSDMARSNEKLDQLHPYTQTLSLSDIESCVRLENAAFPPEYRASHEKFLYRLKQCGELSMGIFTSQDGKSTTVAIPTAATAAPVSSGDPERKSILLGHILATKTTNPTVKDNDMQIPSSDDTSDARIGHQEDGKTICIHSLAILPDYQKRGLGQTLMKAYMQRIESHAVADRVALLAQDHLIPFYENLGFVNMGKSAATFGGGGWNDLVKELDPQEAALLTLG